MSNEKDKHTANGIAYRYLDSTNSSRKLETEIVAALTTARKEAREEAFKEAITETCLDCAEGDPPAYDVRARWYYHGEGREQVGCSASKLRMLEAAATTHKGENDG